MIDIQVFPLLLGLSAAMFTIGSVGVLVRRNPLVVLMSIELMLNAVNLAIVAFGAFVPNLQGNRAPVDATHNAPLLQFKQISTDTGLRRTENAAQLFEIHELLARKKLLNFQDSFCLTHINPLTRDVSTIAVHSSRKQ